MPEEEVRKIADNSKLIVNGYAFNDYEGGLIRILNLNHPDCAMVVNRSCEIIETNMDQIEQQIVVGLCRRNLQFMED